MRDEVSNVRTSLLIIVSRGWIGREKSEKEIRHMLPSQPFPRGKRMTKLYLSAFFASRSLSTCFFRDVAKFGKQPSGHPERWILDNDAIENARIAMYRRLDYVPKRYNYEKNWCIIKKNNNSKFNNVNNLLFYFGDNINKY